MIDSLFHQKRQLKRRHILMRFVNALIADRLDGIIEVNGFTEKMLILLWSMSRNEGDSLRSRLSESRGTAVCRHSAQDASRLSN